MRRAEQPRPAEVVLSWNGTPTYLVDLDACRRALVAGPGGEHMSSYGVLARQAGVARATVSEFFRGKTKSIDVGKRVIAALGLKFDDVARWIEPEPLRAAG